MGKVIKASEVGRSKKKSCPKGMKRVGNKCKRIEKEEYDIEWVKEAGSYDKYLIPKEFGNLYPNKKKK